MKYLRTLLPEGWQNFFQVRRTGKYWGTRIICPHCEATPPQHLRYGSQRWRWLAVHESTVHSGGYRHRMLPGSKMIQ